MIAFIEGKVCDKSGGQLVLETGGVGFLLSCSMNTLQNAPAIGNTMRCYTYFSVREDAMELFGFATPEEKTLFLRLIAVSGVGPKMALGLLGAMPVNELNMAILTENFAALSRAPGIGKKTAERIVMELRDKIQQTDMDGLRGGQSALNSQIPAGTDSITEALEALIALGYSQVEARTALSQVKDKSDKTDELISQALRAMVSVNT